MTRCECATCILLVPKHAAQESKRVDTALYVHNGHLQARVSLADETQISWCSGKPLLLLPGPFCSLHIDLPRGNNVTQVSLYSLFSLILRWAVSTTMFSRHMISTYRTFTIALFVDSQVGGCLFQLVKVGHAREDNLSSDGRCMSGGFGPYI